MTYYVKYALVYNPRKKLNRYGRAQVYVCASLYKEGREYFATGLEIEPSEWDEKRGQLDESLPYGNYKNAECAGIIRQLVDIEMKIRMRGERVTLYAIKQAYHQSGDTGFYAFVEKELLHESGCSFNTLTGRKSVCHALKEYCPSLTFHALTPAFLKGFEQHLYSRGMKPGSVSEYLVILRVFVRAAVRMGHMTADENPFRTFSIRKVHTVRKSVPEETLRRLEQLTFADQEAPLRTARDLFLFSCYTGLRFSDVMRLQPEHIRCVAGKRQLQLQTQKTGQTVCIPVETLFEGKALRLIEAYRGETYCFPTCANNRINERLKIIGRRIGATQELTFHQARHTFACLLADRGANPYTIKYLMGHASIQTSMIYIHTSLAGVESDLARIGVM
ncbi:MAG: site-specific integrase [Bacteroidales bacterium]|nr:site-specific integrase [Bacteroidales bacterium]